MKEIIEYLKDKKKLYKMLKTILYFTPIFILSNKIFCTDYEVFNIPYYYNFFTLKNDQSLKVISLFLIMFFIAYTLTYFVLPDILSLIKFKFKEENKIKTNNKLSKLKKGDFYSMIDNNAHLMLIRDVLEVSTFFIFCFFCLGILTGFVLMPIIITMSIYYISVINWNVSKNELNKID